MNSSNRAKYYNIIIISLIYTWKRIFILKKFFFLICHFDLFRELIISFITRVICCNSTNAKWIFNHIGMIFQVINAFSNPVNNILSRWRWKLKTLTRKLQMSWKKNWNPLLRSTEESTLNQNSFRVLIILYVTNFSETRKLNSNAIWVLSLLLNFRKSRKCALN